MEGEGVDRGDEWPGHVYYAALDLLLRKLLPGRGLFCGVSVTGGIRCEVIIRSARTREVLGEQGARIREIRSHVRHQFGDNAVELYVERVDPCPISPRVWTTQPSFPLFPGETECTVVSCAAAKLLRTQQSLPRLLSTIEQMLEHGPSYAFRLLREHAMRLRSIRQNPIVSVHNDDWGTHWDTPAGKPSSFDRCSSVPSWDDRGGSVPVFPVPPADPGPPLSHNKDLTVVNLAGDHLCVIKTDVGDRVHDAMRNILKALGPPPPNVRKSELLLPGGEEALGDDMLLTKVLPGERITLLRWVSLY